MCGDQHDVHGRGFLPDRGVFSFLRCQKAIFRESEALLGCQPQLGSVSIQRHKRFQRATRRNGFDRIPARCELCDRNAFRRRVPDEQQRGRLVLRTKRQRLLRGNMNAAVFIAVRESPREVFHPLRKRRRAV